MLERKVNIDAYNELCDRVRSSILYAENIKRKNKKRKIAIQELIETVYRDEMELIDRIESLEESINYLCNDINNENVTEKCNHPS